MFAESASTNNKDAPAIDVDLSVGGLGVWVVGIVPHEGQALVEELNGVQSDVHLLAAVSFHDFIHQLLAATLQVRHEVRSIAGQLRQHDGGSKLKLQLATGEILKRSSRLVLHERGEQVPGNRQQMGDGSAGEQHIALAELVVAAHVRDGVRKQLQLHPVFSGSDVDQRVHCKQASTDTEIVLGGLDEAGEAVGAAAHKNASQ